MLQLPNNCRSGKFSVYPANWKTVRANASLTWRISFWFFDDNTRQKKKVVIKSGINQLATTEEKRDAVKALMDYHESNMLHGGYNHITKVHSVVDEDSDISEFTPFIEALDWAFEHKKADKETKIDIKSVLKYVKQAIHALHYDRLPIGQVKKKHLKFVLEKCGKIKLQTKIPIGKTGRYKAGVWNANQFNHYRKYLSALYNELAEVDAVEGNPVEFIKKETQDERIRETLTAEQRQIINKVLYDNHYSFWRFLQIFFHSGARIIELMNVQDSDVDLQNQRFKVLVKKGSRHIEKWRTIKTVALPLWQEVILHAKKGQYLFSTSLMPGENVIRREQITRRWRRHVKDALGVTADFYSLKHTNLDEIAKHLDLKEAQAAAGHSTPIITMKYAVGEEARKHNRLKDVANTF